MFNISQVSTSQLRLCVQYGLSSTRFEALNLTYRYDWVSNSVKQIVLGTYHACFVSNSSEVFCYGRNQGGQLGLGHNLDSMIPVKVSGLSGVSQVSAGADSTCALMTLGGIKCWGKNDLGQLGNGTTVDSNVPVNVLGISTAVEVQGVEGGSHYCAKLADKTVKCWGNGSNFRTGSTTLRLSTPALVSGFTDVNNIALSTSSTCASTDDGKVKCVGYGCQLGRGATVSGTACSSVNETNAKFVLNEDGSELQNVSKIGGGNGQGYCAILTDGQVKCWQDSSRLFGSSSRFAKLFTGIAGVEDVVFAPNNVCFQVVGGSVSCLGSNRKSELGQFANMVVSTSPVGIPSVYGAKQLTFSDATGCVLRQDGLVTCWGSNNIGLFGSGSSGVVAPKSLELEPGIFATQVHNGMGNRCAIGNDSDKTVYCWGAGSDNFAYGEGYAIGANNQNIQFEFPRKVGVQQAVSLYGNAHAVCAILVDKTVKCWGFNGAGEMMKYPAQQSTSNNQPDVVANINQTNISKMVGITSLYTNSGAFCAIIDGALKCWGDNSAFHRFGLLNTNLQNSLIAQVGGASSTIMTVGIKDAYCTLKTDNTVACMGQNRYGQLGDGASVSGVDLVRSTPVNVQGISSASKITYSFNNGNLTFCALLADAKVKCWGWNGEGQLGRNSLIGYSSTPQSIIKGETFSLSASGTIVSSVDSSEMTNVLDLVGFRDGFCALVDNDGSRLYCWGDGSRSFYLPVIRQNKIALYPSMPLIDKVSEATNAQNPSLKDKVWSKFIVSDLVSNPVYDSITFKYFEKKINQTTAEVVNGNLITPSGNAYGYISNTYLTPISPVEMDQNVVDVAASLDSFCAVKTDKKVYCWGYGNAGEIGDGKAGLTGYVGYTVTIPTQVANITNAIQVVATQVGSWSAFCALLEDKTVKCWGANTQGQLGDNTTTLKSAPVSVLLGASALTNVKSLGSFRGGFCAIVENAGIYCWGSNALGYFLQNSSRSDINKTAQLVISGTQFESLTLNSQGEGICYKKINDPLSYCWGNNNQNQNLTLTPFAGAYTWR